MQPKNLTKLVHGLTAWKDKSGKTLKEIEAV